MNEVYIFNMGKHYMLCVRDHFPVIVVAVNIPCMLLNQLAISTSPTIVGE